MRNILCCALSTLFLAASSAAFGADFWENKQYDKWSQKECDKLLENSPWAKDFTLVDSGLQQTAGVSDDGQQLNVKYQMQFRSALPIRQAQVRQMQIAQKYDSLNPEQKEQFDQKAKTFLAEKFSDIVVLYVKYTTNSQITARALERYWQSQTTDLLKNTVSLRNSKGEQAVLAQFNATTDRSFQFIFPRQINGKPLISPEDNSFTLEFSYPVVDIPGGNNKLGDGKGYMEFKLKKMAYQGALAY